MNSKRVKIDQDINPTILVDSIVEGIQEKKGTNIVVLDLRKIDHAICSYFVICEGSSNTQVDAIANSVFDYVREKNGEKPYKSEGFENAEWILLDYVDVVVHVFRKDVRSFYRLEALWGDGVRKDIEDLF
ncbi:MAG: ribosome silencing factor [Breznakibacter sp.]|nr:ribosome silencing factor [Breznakibacter sp.]